MDDYIGEGVKACWPPLDKHTDLKLYRQRYVVDKEYFKTRFLRVVTSYAEDLNLPDSELAYEVLDIIMRCFEE